jgi:hypothetical protein
MSERSSAPSARPMRSTPTGDMPPPDITEFIRFCHRRRRVGWPEIYDEMCAVAARREFNGWDHDELARRGLTFSLFEMPRLAGWVRVVLAGSGETREAVAVQVTPQPVPG